jgi:hypothetical protein
MTRPNFESFPKIPRLRREVIITEKIDGTNAQIVVTPEGEVFAGSRNRWITPEDDNYGFATWVKKNEDELRLGLGIGQHFGEWWGAGIGRKYDLSERRFSLFNTSRWKPGSTLPASCRVVPVLAIGQFADDIIAKTLQQLKESGSIAEPGYMKPEGIVVYMCASQTMHKVLLEGDELPKGFKPKNERDAEAANV